MFSYLTENFPVKIICGGGMLIGAEGFFLFVFFMVSIFHIMFNYQCFKKQSPVVSLELGSMAHWVGGRGHVTWLCFTICMWALASGAPRRDSHSLAPGQGETHCSWASL